MIKLIVCGAAGRMGSRIIELSREDSSLSVVGAVEFAGHPMIGKGEPVITNDISGAIKNCDVIIDFTSVESSLKTLEQALKNKKAIVIGTTGFSEQQKDVIKKASATIPVLFSPNMSVGVNILFKLVNDAAKAMPGYDVEILELHHNKKKDSPSGTAAKLFNIVAKALGKNPETAGVYGRKGMVGERKSDEIGVHSVRAGDIVGEHTVYFAGPGERIELTHRAHSRDTLVQGALVAAKWLSKQKPGLYDMSDALGIK